MNLVIRRLRKPPRGGDRSCQLQGWRTFLDDAGAVKFVRDRALDHAVEKERDLRTVVNVKDLIKSEPSKSLPLAIIAQSRDSLRIPVRPIDFLRRYPSIFEEFLPGGIGIHPHVKLTPQVLALDVEEQVIYRSDNHKLDVADRLLKMLMLARINTIPLRVVECLKWDLGLPQDYLKTIIPEFPDYFRVGNGVDPCLELVCWSDELAKSAMETKAMGSENGYVKGMPIAFTLQYSRGFEMDKKFKKWVDEWQKLPYISPYENASHLLAKSDESDKWAVALLHEVLNVMIPKKTKRDNILFLGEFLGVRSRFKRALLQHPGIFYVSTKLRTHTVVLRTAYKRDLLVGKPHPVMELRSKYLHLMKFAKGKNKLKSELGDQKQKASNDSRGKRQNLTYNKRDDEGEVFDSSSDSGSEDFSNHESDYEFENKQWKHPASGKQGMKKKVILRGRQL